MSIDKAENWKVCKWNLLPLLTPLRSNNFTANHFGNGFCCLAANLFSFPILKFPKKQETHGVKNGVNGVRFHLQAEAGLHGEHLDKLLLSTAPVRDSMGAFCACTLAPYWGYWIFFLIRFACGDCPYLLSIHSSFLKKD